MIQNGRLYHIYDFKRNPLKQFNIKIQGVCQSINWSWDWIGKYENKCPTFIKYAGKQKYIDNENNLKIREFETDIINVQKIITSINKIENMDIYSYLYYFANLPNLYKVQTKENSTQCKFKIPVISQYTDAINKVSYDFGALFRNCESLSDETISQLSLPWTNDGIDINRINSYSINNLFNSCNNISNLPQKIYELIDNINYDRYHDEYDNLLETAKFNFTYNALMNSTSLQWSLQNRLMYGYTLDSWNFGMYGINQQTNNEESANTKLLDEDGNQLSSLVKYIYPNRTNSIFYLSKT